MDADQLVEEFGAHQLQAGLEQLGAHGEDHQTADEEHDQRERHVHRPDVLVVRRRQPAQQAARVMVVGQLIGGVGQCAHGEWWPDYGKPRSPDIALVYKNLMKGSCNHLRALVSALAAQGVVYAPQYLSVQACQAIIDSSLKR